ncbi:hypothetical protein BDC45DRAFT_571141 [Circinella umbellata]|nr:hypothetical protein BDC45DRAFT_571141 [Circinella umbellata]
MKQSLCTFAQEILGFEPCENVNGVLHKDSQFRFWKNITKLLIGKEPFDAYHGLQRANEELLILTDEATSVLKYADVIVEKLRNALNIPQMLGKKQQEKLLMGIFNETAALAAGSTISIDKYEKDVLVEADGVTDELGRMEEEVMDDQQFEVDTDFVNMWVLTVRFGSVPQEN